MRVRRLHKRPAALEITAFLNLIVVLVPFLLSTAVFSRLAVLQLTLPAQSSSFDKLTTEHLNLEIVIRPDALEVGTRDGGLVQRIPNSPTGYDYKALSDLMEMIKQRVPDKKDAAVLAQPDTPYDVLVHVMDAVRVGHAVEGTSVVQTELFPEISVGDAPERARSGT